MYWERLLMRALSQERLKVSYFFNVIHIWQILFVFRFIWMIFVFRSSRICIGKDCWCGLCLKRDWRYRTFSMLSIFDKYYLYFVSSEWFLYFEVVVFVLGKIVDAGSAQERLEEACSRIWTRNLCIGIMSTYFYVQI